MSSVSDLPVSHATVDDLDLDEATLPDPNEQNEDETEDELSEVEGNDVPGEGTAKKKKKKKKKKDKKKPTGTDDIDSPLPSPDAATRRAADKRFTAAISSLTANSEDELWVRLDNAYLTESKTKKLCEALKANTHVLSIDLSGNNLGTAAVVALCSTLSSSSAAPDLIELRLMDNPVGETGLDAIKELAKVRKTLKVETGASTTPVAVAAPTQSPQQQEEVASSTSATSAATTTTAAATAATAAATTSSGKSNIVSKFFQVGNDDDGEDGGDAGGGGASGDGQGGGYADNDTSMGLVPEHMSALLWDKVLEAMDVGDPHIPSISDPLRAIAAQVELEMNSCALPMLDDTTIDDLKPFSNTALLNLRLLCQLMDLEPATGLAQYSKDQPVARVGTHRYAVAELVAQLMRAECVAVVAAVAETGLLSKCMKLALERPNNSSMQCAVLRSLRCSVSPGCGSCGAWKEFLEGDVHATVAEIATASQGVKIGDRPPHAGFAIAVAEILCIAARGGAQQPPPALPPPDDTAETTFSSPNQQIEEEDDENEDKEERTSPAGPSTPGDEKEKTTTTTATLPTAEVAVQTPSLAPWQQDLATTLEGSPQWMSFVREEGPLAGLLTAQQMELGGPRPQRLGPQAEMEAELAALGGNGQMISGQELLALLRGLSFGRMNG